MMDTPHIDLSSPAFIADPYPAFRTLQATGPRRLPFASMTGSSWVFSRYDDVVAVLKELRTGKDFARLVPEEQLWALDRSMLFRDPPDHTRLRSLASQAFTPAAVRDLEPRIAQIAADLLAQMRPAGSAAPRQADFMTAYALPLPLIVIAELLGVPIADRARFHAWSNAVVSEASSTEEPLTWQDATTALTSYFADLIQERRRHPQADLISGLIQAGDAGDRLSEQELIGTCILLLIAGHETTVNLLGNGLLTLLRHPDQLALLRAHPELMPSAVEEMLRFESPVQRATFRIVTDDFAISGGTLHRGQEINVFLGAANRDPQQFPEPDCFDIRRQPNRHIAFGLGIHFCLGAPLARAEARIGFEQLLQALPDLQLAGEPVWNQNTFIRGLRVLPIGY
jgi:pimeloyl-[acyl-carrier protein] synthase